MDITEARSEFPVTRTCAFMNHAAVAPLSQRAVNAMRGLLDDLLANGDQNSKQWDLAVQRTRELAAQLINASPSEIAFVKNTTEGIAHVANGFPWSPGDNVVVTNVEFPANVYPWLNLADRGVETRFVKEKAGRIPFEDISDAIDSRTRIVSLSYVEFVSGFRNDLGRLGELCRKRGALFVVDAIQGLGVLKLDVQECGVDFLSADGHKWLLAPEGAGVFFCSNRVADRLRVSEMGWMAVQNAGDYLRYPQPPRTDARRFECGSHNTLGLHGLGAAIDLLLEVGIPNIERRVLALTDRLCDGLARKGYHIFSSRREGEKSGIVSFHKPGQDTRALFQRLRAEKIIVALREGFIRVSPHFYNSDDEIDRLLAALP